MAQGRISGRLLRDDLARDTNLTFDTTTLVIDYVNNKVAIGTGTATDLLTVAGNVTAGNIQLSNNSILSVNSNADIVLSPNGSGNINISTSFINNVVDPVQDQDVASKKYVDDAIVAGGSDASIGNLTISNVTFTSTTPSDDIIFDAETGVVQIVGTTGFVIPVGTTAQRSGSPETGLTRYNSSTGLLELYDGAGWEGIGDYTPIVDNFDGDGSTVAFTLSASSTTDGLIVDVNGVLQLGGTAYNVSTTTLTFTEAPAAGDKITARFLTKTLYNAISDAAGSTTQVQFNDAGLTGADAGLTYNKTTDALTVGGTLTIGGLLQAPQATKLANATGTAGQISWDANYIYVCTATDTWKRVGLTGGY